MCNAAAEPGPAPVHSGLGLEAQARAWLTQDPDSETRAELESVLASGSPAELAARFGGRLEFGTAGLRGEMGAGPRRMNRVVVRQTTAGLAHHVLGRVGPGRVPEVVVGYDARRNSAVFAADVAAVADEFGLNVAAFSEPVPTPLLAFAVLHRAADAGVMITASHNPPADNGYKVYLNDGAQIIPPHDATIAAAIVAAAETPLDLRPRKTTPVALAVQRLGMDVRDAYLDAIIGQAPVPTAREVSVVYTPLCGVGGAVALAAFERASFPRPHLVAEQAEPDGRFPGLPFPNPEEPGVLDRAIALAVEIGADVVLANDPDADRLGVAIPDGPAGWRVLSGNEIGALLADHLLSHTVGADRLVVTTVVSSRLVQRMAEAAGIHFAATLTGFKWIVRPALAHPEWRFLFGYEEALGYSVGPAVWDKDGIAAALVFAELTAALRAAGSTPAQRLEDLARQHGLHATDQWSLRFGGPNHGAAASAATMRRIRQRPGEVAGLAVVAVVDLAEGGNGLAPTDAVIWDLADGGRVVFRPSGTEPKLKVYFEVIEPVPPGTTGYARARATATRRLADLRRAVAPLADRR